MLSPAVRWSEPSLESASGDRKKFMSKPEIQIRSHERRTWRVGFTPNRDRKGSVKIGFKKCSDRWLIVKRNRDGDGAPKWPCGPSKLMKTAVVAHALQRAASTLSRRLVRNPERQQGAFSGERQADFFTPPASDWC